MGIFKILIESPAGSGAFVNTGKLHDESALGYVGLMLAALSQQTGQSFSATLLSGTALISPTIIQQPSTALQTSAASLVSAGISNGASILTDLAGNMLTDLAGNLLANC